METLTATESYLSLLLALPELTPLSVLSIFFLTLARLLPVLALAPFLGSQNVPMTIRMMFAVALTAIFLPQNLLLVQKEIPFSMTFVALCLKELIFGLFLGLLAAIPFFIAQMAGSIIDFQRGASSLQVTDPTTRSQTGPFGILFNYVLIAVFFALGGPFLFFNAVATSYQLIPVDGLINPLMMNMNVPFWTTSFAVAEKAFNLSIQLAAPGIIGILFSDLFLGIANRMAPQVQIVFLGISLKSWVGIAMVTAAWSLIIQVMSQESLNWFKNLTLLIQQIGRTFVTH